MEPGIECRANRINATHAGNRDQRNEQCIFDGGRAAAIFNEISEHDCPSVVFTLCLRHLAMTIGEQEHDRTPHKFRGWTAPSVAGTTLSHG